MEKTDTGRDWGQEEQGMTEDEMAGWHHQLNGRECEETPRESEGQEAWLAEVEGSRKESDTTECLNNREGWGHSPQIHSDQLR